jgi:sphinganine-1-phosphate aldolase
MATSVLPVALQNKLLGYGKTPSAQLAILNLDL